MNDSTNNLLVSTTTGGSGGHPVPVEDGSLQGHQTVLLSVNVQQGQQQQDGRMVEEQEEEAMEEGGQDDSIVVVPDNIRLVFHSIIKHYCLSREQFISMYDDYLKTKMADEEQEEEEQTEPPNTIVNINSEEDKEAPIHLHIAEEPMLARVVTETAEPTCSPVAVRNEPLPIQVEGLQGEVNRLQSVVQSAMENYVSSPVVVNNTSSSTRSSLTLTDEPLPSTFARELLQRDQSLVAQAIRKYLQQYSIPQREVVEKTGINQSHLSQHFTRGVPIKPAKRVKLYHWFEQDQLERTGKLLTADGSLTSVLESPKVEGYRRRPRWRWSPVATQILTEAFKKNRFPTRDQRLELSRICNDAESAMNNGEPIQVQGPSGDTEGITEQRINTWFTNRRKGLVSPSPTAESFGSLSGLSILTSPNALGSTPNLDTPTAELSANSMSTPARPPNMTASSPLTINFTNSTPSSTPSSSTAGPNTAPNNSQDSNTGISITAPFALSPVNLQALLNQLQGQTLAPVLQNLGQILVGQLPQGLMLQSPQGAISLEALTKQLNVVDTLTAATATESGPSGDSNEEASVNGGSSNPLAVNQEEEIIISNTAQPSAINSRQN